MGFLVHPELSAENKAPRIGELWTAGYKPYSLGYREPLTCGVFPTGCPPPTVSSAGDFGRASDAMVNVTCRLSPAFKRIR